MMRPELTERAGLLRPHVPREALVTMGVFVGSLCLTLLLSWVPSFWWDETATLRLAALSGEQFFDFIAGRDVVHATYGWFMHAWITAFGSSEFAVRLPSAIAIALSAVGVYALTRMFGGAPRNSIGAAVVFVFLPRIVLHGVEARSYAIAVALTTGAAILIVRARERESPRLWVGYVLTATVGIWCFAYVALVLPAFAILADTTGHPLRRRLWRASIVVLLPAVLAAPLFVMMMQQAEQVAWLAGQDLNLYTVLIEPQFGWAAWLALAVVLLLGIGAWTGRLRWTPVTVGLVVWAVLPTAALILVTLVHTPVFTPRYLTVSAPAVAILCGMAMNGLRRRWVIAVFVAWVLAAMPFYVGSRLPTSKPGGLDLRSVATSVSDRATAGDGFLLAADTFSPLRPRVAAMAYPAEFADLRDLALDKGYVETGTYWDVLGTPAGRELDQVERVWVAAYPKDPFAQTLKVAGFDRTLITTISGIEIARWQR